MVRDFQEFERLVFELAAFLDPVAFERAHDRSLDKRRRAAWRKAANRLSQPLTQPAAAVRWVANGMTNGHVTAHRSPRGSIGERVLGATGPQSP
jgi:hypothetical protein